MSSLSLLIFLLSFPHFLSRRCPRSCKLFNTGCDTCSCAEHTRSMLLPCSIGINKYTQCTREEHTTRHCLECYPPYCPDPNHKNNKCILCSDIIPSNDPTNAPTPSPTNIPSNGPTYVPTNAPTPSPTNIPSTAPTPVWYVKWIGFGLDVFLCFCDVKWMYFLWNFDRFWKVG